MSQVLTSALTCRHSDHCEISQRRLLYLPHSLFWTLGYFSNLQMAAKHTRALSTLTFLRTNVRVNTKPVPLPRTYGFNNNSGNFSCTRDEQFGLCLFLWIQSVPGPKPVVCLFLSEWLSKTRWQSVDISLYHQGCSSFGRLGNRWKYSFLGMEITNG